MEPELDPVDLEDRSILSSSEQDPVSSEGVVVAISDAISELRSPKLLSEDLTGPEGPSAEVAWSSSGNDQGGADASPETPDEDIPTGECQQSIWVTTLQWHANRMSFKSDKRFMFNLLLNIFLITYCLLFRTCKSEEDQLN